jgi:hypothetical protein
VRIAIAVLAALVLVGCGSEKNDQPLDAADINRNNHAKEAIFLQRVLGDDPISESVSLRVDGTAAVRRGGGRGYWDVALVLSKAQAERSLTQVRAAPFARLEDHTIMPGGFGGWDNDRRYLMRRDGVSIAVGENDLPKSMRPLVRDLNKMIDGELGHIVADDRHFSASGVTGSDASDDDATPPSYESSPATPVSGGQGPRPELNLSCYGSGGRQGQEAQGKITAGPLTLEGLGGGRVVKARAIVAPGAAVTIAVEGRAGLLYGRAWQGDRTLDNAVKVVRLEGCSDTTTGGGAARFEGGIVRRGKRCVTLRIHAGGDTFRRRVGC